MHTSLIITLHDQNYCGSAFIGLFTWVFVPAITPGPPESPGQNPVKPPLGWGTPTAAR